VRPLALLGWRMLAICGGARLRIRAQHSSHLPLAASSLPAGRTRDEVQHWEQAAVEQCLQDQLLYQAAFVVGSLWIRQVVLAPSQPACSPWPTSAQTGRATGLPACALHCGTHSPAPATPPHAPPPRPAGARA
jgi:hypothetical protein